MAERAAGLFGQSSPPLEVRVEPHHTVHVAHCTFPTGRYSCVVKHYMPVAGSPTVRVTREVHDAASRMSRLLHEHTVRFLDIDEEHDLVFMDYVEGPSLEEMLSRRSAGAAEEERRVHALRQVARVLRRMHSLETEKLPIEPRGRPNASYRRQLAKLGRESDIVRGLPDVVRSLDRFFERFPAEFWERVDERLNFGDLQPKNVLLRPDGRICVIDIGYACGHPAQNVAFLMLGLDVLNLRWPSQRSLHSVARWKGVFLDKYLAKRPDRELWIRQDLAFFYVRTLVTLGTQHIRRRRWARPYLAWFYGRRLRSFLADLEAGDEAGDGLRPS